MSKRTCEMPGCTQPHRAGGKCITHYMADRRGKPECITPGCRKLPAARKRCRPHERLSLTEGRTEKQQRQWLAKFRSYIEADPVTECWLWTGPTNDDGYGMMQAGGGAWYAHRFAYVWFNGGHAPKRELDHICNVPLCVRPDHLWPITATENKSLQHQRALAGDQEFWRHTTITEASPDMVSWAQAEGLPWRKPGHRVKLSELRARAAQTTNNPTA